MKHPNIIYNFIIIFKSYYLSLPFFPLTKKKAAMVRTMLKKATVLTKTSSTKISSSSKPIQKQHRTGIMIKNGEIINMSSSSAPPSQSKSKFQSEPKPPQSESLAFPPTPPSQSSPTTPLTLTSPAPSPPPPPPPQPSSSSSTLSPDDIAKKILCDFFYFCVKNNFF